MPRRARAVAWATAVLLTLVTGCEASRGDPAGPPRAGPSGPPADDPADEADETGEEPAAQPRGTITLGFAGDVHFEAHLRQMLDQGTEVFGSMRPAMREVDLMMLNLESTITRGTAPFPKQYTFRTGARVLGMLDDAGVDVVSMGNNHAADHGAAGLRQTLRAIERSPVPVVGVGADAEAAFAGHRESVGDTTVSFFATTTIRERTAEFFSAGPARPGVAFSREPRRRLLDSVRAADERGDVVVVYLHWGEEYKTCPRAREQRHAEALVAAGADVLVGTHAHRLQGGGWTREGAYVAYGLSNYVWYHSSPPETGMLKLTVTDGAVVDDRWIPGRIDFLGPERVRGRDAASAIRDWRALRSCTGLAAAPPA